MLEQDEHTTDVILRRWRSGDKEVLAVFPGISGGYRGEYRMESYQHIGQHSACDYYGAILPLTRPCPAADPDAADLLRELESMGYRPRVVRKVTKRHDEARREQEAR
jgi:hypothetical protein